MPDGVLINGEYFELMEDGRLPLYQYFPEGSKLFDPAFTPPRMVMIIEDDSTGEKGVTLFRLQPGAAYFSYHISSDEDPSNNSPQSPSSARFPTASGGIKAFKPLLNPAAAVAAAAGTADANHTDANGVTAPSSHHSPPLTPQPYKDYNSLSASAQLAPAVPKETIDSTIDELIETYFEVSKQNKRETQDRKSLTNFLRAQPSHLVKRFIMVHQLNASATANFVGRSFEHGNNDFVIEANVMSFLDDRHREKCRGTAYVQLLSPETTVRLLTQKAVHLPSGDVAFIEGSDRKPCPHPDLGSQALPTEPGPPPPPPAIPPMAPPVCDLTAVADGSTAANGGMGIHYNNSGDDEAPPLARPSKFAAFGGGQVNNNSFNNNIHGHGHGNNNGMMGGGPHGHHPNHHPHPHYNNNQNHHHYDANRNVNKLGSGERGSANNGNTFPVRIPSLPQPINGSSYPMRGQMPPHQYPNHHHHQHNNYHQPHNTNTNHPPQHQHHHNQSHNQPQLLQNSHHNNNDVASSGNSTYHPNNNNSNNNLRGSTLHLRSAGLPPSSSPASSLSSSTGTPLSQSTSSSSAPHPGSSINNGHHNISGARISSSRSAYPHNNNNINNSIDRTSMPVTAGVDNSNNNNNFNTFGLNHSSGGSLNPDSPRGTATGSGNTPASSSTSTPTTSCPPAIAIPRPRSQNTDYFVYRISRDEADAAAATGTCASHPILLEAARVGSESIIFFVLEHAPIIFGCSRVSIRSDSSIGLDWLRSYANLCDTDLSPNTQQRLAQMNFFSSFEGRMTKPALAVCRELHELLCNTGSGGSGAPVGGAAAGGPQFPRSVNGPANPSVAATAAVRRPQNAPPLPVLLR